MKIRAYESPELAEIFLTPERGFAESRNAATIHEWGEDDSDELYF